GLELLNSSNPPTLASQNARRPAPVELLLSRPREERGSSSQTPAFSYFWTVGLLRGPRNHREYQIPHF
uniref:Uncharacterized protein n=1 Tax=Prolemur simus TaxID=1328070 RepID=A0A8C8Z6S8_PROSS